MCVMQQSTERQTCDNRVAGINYRLHRHSIFKIQIAQSRFASVGSLIGEFVSNPIKIKTSGNEWRRWLIPFLFLSCRNLILVRRIIASESSLRTVRIFHGCRRSSRFNFISRQRNVIHANILPQWILEEAEDYPQGILKRLYISIQSVLFLYTCVQTL